MHVHVAGVSKIVLFLLLIVIIIITWMSLGKTPPFFAFSVFWSQHRKTMSIILVIRPSCATLGAKPELRAGNEDQKPLSSVGRITLLSFPPRW